MRSSRWTRLSRVCALGLLWACGQPSASAPLAAEPHAPPLAGARWPELVVLERANDVPKGADGPELLTLAFRHADGRLQAIEGQARSFAPFRDGVALVDTARRLWLVSAKGERRLLANNAGAPPVQAQSGALVYVAHYPNAAELHLLSGAGIDTIIASGFANAGVLTPLSDGRVLFVAAHSGGVAGLWLADADGARCLTNCALQRAPWGDAFVPPPGHRDAIEVRDDHAHYEDFDGIARSIDLTPPIAPIAPTAPTDGDSQQHPGALR